MRLFTFLRERVADRRPPDFIVGRDGEDYLRRWHLVPRNPLFNVYLHQFKSSDDDRAHHDHPWMRYVDSGDNGKIGPGCAG